MTHVAFGVGFAPNVPVPRVIEAAQLAERLGFDVLWITDSHLAAREAMAMLGALAAAIGFVREGEREANRTPGATKICSGRP